MTRAELAAACALDALLGDPPGLPHPVRWIGAAIGAGGRRRAPASPASSRSPPAALLVVGARRRERGVRPTSPRAAGSLARIVLAASTLAARSLLEAVARVERALAADDLVAARAALRHLVGRDVDELDAPEIARAALEALAESLGDGVAAPLAALVAGGCSAALAFKAISTLDSMIGHREAPHTWFGLVAARTDDVANLVPARLAALAIAARRRAHRRRCRRRGARGIARRVSARQPKRGLARSRTGRRARRAVGRREPLRRRPHGERGVQRRSGETERRSSRARAVRGRDGDRGVGNRGDRGAPPMKAVHGGDVAAAARRLDRIPRTLLDLSANINPAGPPARVRAALRRTAARVSALERYPDPAYTELRTALAQAAKVEPAALAIGNGSAALIGAAVRALAPRCCVLPVPTFSEYRKALHDAHVPTRTFELAAPDFALDLDRLVARVQRTAADLVILANPNNPTGTVLARAALRRFLARTPRTITIVDEAFIDYVPSETLVAGRLPRNLVVLRSLTKFYALPGVRAGYAVARPALAARIEAQLPSWPVGTLDATLAAAALGDAAYDARTRMANAREREWLAGELAALDITTVPARANFLLCDVSRRWNGTAAVLAERLAGDAGILVRTFHDDPVLRRGCWLRVAVRTRRESLRLLAALGRIRGRGRA